MSQTGTEGQSLLDVLLELINNDEAQAAFKANPEQYLHDCGFEELDPQDLYDVYPLFLESSNNVINDGGATVNFEGGDQTAVNTTLPAPEPGDTPLETVVRQVEYITQNFSTTEIDNTNIDNSTNQIFEDVHGDITQTFDNDQVVASGEGSQAAGENAVSASGGSIAAGDDLDITDSNVVTGDVDDSVLADDIDDSAVIGGDVDDSTVIGGDVEDSNVVTGDDNQVGDGSAFGDGSVAASGSGDVQAVTGDHSQGAFGDGSQNVQGDGNLTQGGIQNQNQAQQGDGNTGAFGDGAQASSATATGGGDAISANLDEVDVDDGGALSIGGDASGQNTDIDVDNEDGEVNIATGEGDATQVEDSTLDIDQSSDVHQTTTVTDSEDVDTDTNADIDQDADQIVG